MLPIEELLGLYKQEKAAHDWPSEPYTKTFQEWLAEYKQQYALDHVTVDIKQAMAEADMLVDQAEVELSTTEEEETDMETATAVVVDEAQAKRDAKNKRRRELRAAKKAKRTKGKVRTPRAQSKLARARDLYAKMKGKDRADVISAFRKRLGLSDACASTYYQTCKAA